MLGYLKIDTCKNKLEIELVKKKKFGHFLPHYHKTTREIFEITEHIDGIVIPYELGNLYDYDVLLMILHIRLFPHAKLSQLPIVVYTENEEEYYDFLGNGLINEKVYKSIGVSIPVPPLEESVELLKVDKSALKQFLKEKAGYPRLEGRHDQANRWGPFIFLSVLNDVFDGYSAEVKSVENRMFEEPYLKWLASGISGHSSIENAKTILTSERHYLNTQLKKMEYKEILIIEDKLDDGWKHVYEAVLLDDCRDIKITWARTKKEALDHINGELALVILDMRLDGDDTSEDQPAGMKLAKKFRQLYPLVPVIVATASNKSWMLQRLTDEGIDAYWVKASPEIDLDFSHAVHNVLDFYRKVTSTLEWSSNTRKWSESLYQIANVVAQTDQINGSFLEEKAHSFHALMKKSFTPFSAEISKGLQHNLAFLIAYSCMNDLVSWILIFEPFESANSKFGTWSTEITGERVELLRKSKNEQHELKNNSQKFHEFPDRLVALEVLRRHSLFGQCSKFKKMSKLRNGLPLTHGKSTELRTTSARGKLAGPEEIKSMISILSDLVFAHRPQ